MHKQVYDLTLSDLEKYPVWYFPMDETVEDELSIKPFETGNPFFPDHQILVRTDFFDKDGRQYDGYIYWNYDKSVETLQPAIFVNKEEYLTFWNGIRRPSWEKEGLSQQVLRDKFPLDFVSQEHAGLPSIKGRLLGLYFLDKENQIDFI